MIFSIYTPGKIYLALLGRLNVQIHLDQWNSASPHTTISSQNILHWPPLIVPFQLEQLSYTQSHSTILLGTMKDIHKPNRIRGGFGHVIG